MNIYEALKKDHQKVKSLLSDLVVRMESEQDVSELISQIRDELIPHSRAEEAVFYNPLREVDSIKKEALHGYKEHAEAETLLRSLQMSEKMGAESITVAKKLQEALEHHIREEENEIFPLAKQVLLEGEADQMGQAFERLKPEIREQGFLQTSLDLIANIMPGRFGDSVRSFSVDR